MPRRNSVNRNEVMDMLRREGMYIIETRDDVNKMLDVMARFYADDAYENNKALLKTLFDTSKPRQIPDLSGFRVLIEQFLSRISLLSGIIRISRPGLWRRPHMS